MRLLVLFLALAGIARAGEVCPLYNVASSGSVARGQLELILYQNSRVWLNGLPLHTRSVSDGDPLPRVSLKPGDRLTLADCLVRQGHERPHARHFEQFRLDSLTPKTARFTYSVHAAVPEELGGDSWRFHLGPMESVDHFDVELETFGILYEDFLPGVVAGEPTRRTK